MSQTERKVAELVITFVGTEDLAGRGVYEMDALTGEAGDREIAVRFGRGDLVRIPALDVQARRRASVKKRRHWAKLEAASAPSLIQVNTDAEPSSSVAHLRIGSQCRAAGWAVAAPLFILGSGLADNLE
jgi:hypothetical protein